MKKILVCFTVLATIAIGGCTAKKVTMQKAEGLQEIKEPFDDNAYKSDDKFFRAVGMAKSQDASFAKTKSETEAKSKLASSIQTGIERVFSKYASEYSVDKKQEYNDKSQEMILETTKQSLVEVKQLGQKLFKDQTGGDYVAYTALEVSKESIYNGIKNKISSNEKLRVDFQEAQFKKVFDEQMKKFAEENK